MTRLFLTLCGVNGFLAVALGAFGAHGLKARMAALPDGADRLAWWQTASSYHLAHALALAVAALLAARVDGPWPAIAGYGFQAGILLFCGSLYAMTLTGVRALGAVTPLGGVALLVAWAAVAVAAWKMT